MPKDQTTETPRELRIPETLERACEITRAEAPAEGAEDDRRIELSFSSETTEVERFFGIEVLGHGEGEVDLTWVGSGRAPMLLDHKSGVDNQVGVIERAFIEDGVGRAVVRFGKGARASEILARVRDGELSSISVGYRVRAMKLVEESKAGPDIYRVTDWKPNEISLVSIPADTTVGVGRGSEITVRVDRSDQKPNQMEGEMPPTDTKTKEDEGRATVPAIETKQAAKPELTDEERAEIRAKAAETEAKRCRELEAIGAQFSMPRADIAKAQKDGWTPAEFRGLVLERMGDKAEQIMVTSSMVGLERRDVQEFSLTRLLHALANPQDMKAREAAAHEFAVCSAAEEKSERAVRGSLVPLDILAAPDFVGGGQRDLTKSPATAGGHLVATNLLAGSFIEVLRNRSLFLSLGARQLMGLVGDIAIPRQTGGATAVWIAESGDAGESDPAFDQVTMTPKTVAAYTDASRKLLKQSSLDIENLMRVDLATAVALAIDSAGFNGTGASNQPRGIKNQTGVNTTTFAAVNPTFAEIVAMETAVANDNADIGALAYAFDPTFRGHFKTTEKFTSTGMTIWEPGDTVNGYRAGVTKQVVAGDVFFGNFADALVGMWGGLDVLVDPYAQSLKGAIRVIVHQDVDEAVRHPDSFCISNDGV